MPRIPRDGVPKPKPKPKVEGEGEGERQLVSFPLIVAPPQRCLFRQGGRRNPLGTAP
jgi:hypothetical protein